MDFSVLESAILKYHPTPDLHLVQRAFDFARQHHEGHKRANGEPYFNHLLESALLAAQLKLDLPSIASALLHDTIEDRGVSRETLVVEFNQEIADIVEGVTKLTRMEFQSREENQAESFRKLLIAMAKDIRVVLVKLCDRLHNMRTLQHVSEESQLRKALETKEIYAPLANRLGIHWLKSELEDLSFLYLRPVLYHEIKQKFDATAKERELYIADTANELVKVLETAGISASVKGRAKHLYSIWQKMERLNLSFEEIHDLLGFRIVVPTVRACYESLGVIHSVWPPIPNRFKDYIAMPKSNHYQSLHTAVVGPQGQRIEVQIRTPDMNRVADEGIAAHWRYKEGGLDAGFDLQWVRDLVETQQYLKNPDDFIQSVKGELFPDDVFVLTPRGDPVKLPYGATPIDFAYAVHTDVGHHTTGARVNGVLVPLSHQLGSGDTVEILTAKDRLPSKDWLAFVKSSKAKQRIRSYLKNVERERSGAIGEEILAKDLKRVKLTIKKVEKSGKLDEVARELGLAGVAELYAEIGYGKIQSAQIVKKVLPEDQSVDEKLSRPASALERIFQRAARASRSKVGVSVSGFDDILVRFAKCCEPLPGDRIVGFITRGRGVTVHYANCPQVMKSDPLRTVQVFWDDAISAPRKVTLLIHSEDQVGLLVQITKAISTSGSNINSAQIKTTGLGKATHQFEITIENAKQLAEVSRAIEKINGVIKVERLRSASSGAELE